LRGRGRRRRKGKHLVELGVNEFDGDLNGGQAVVAGKINRALGVLKVVGLERIGGPVAKASHEKLRAHMLQQYFHKLGLSYAFFSGFNANLLLP
jgi:hypothetical protein